MWLMLQQPEPDDYVLASGEAHSVRDFVEEAFRHVGRDIQWQGVGAEEKGLDAKSGDVLVQVDPRYFRPSEVDLLIGDPTKAREKLGWHHSVSFSALVQEMVEADLDTVKGESERLSRHD
jgi:GDPmannose 4,6-dehydratase